MHWLKSSNAVYAPVTHRKVIHNPNRKIIIIITEITYDVSKGPLDICISQVCIYVYLLFFLQNSQSSFFQDNLKTHSLSE